MHNNQQSGLTLVEMITSLTIMALAATLVVNVSVTQSSKLVMNEAVTQFAVDLRRSRQLALGANKAVSVHLSKSGYQINALALSRDWPKGMIIAQQTRLTEIRFLPAPTLDAYEVVFNHGNATKTVSIAPLTGKVTIHD